ncbi:MAG: peptide chain release factor N(5)-glutamine methyltransferase [Actinomycetota bacterium]|nr:peptide chain release factor N(5)-glutamine methyltransferase [Actinomycetota bacterium]
MPDAATVAATVASPSARSLLADAGARLSAAGVDSPRLDAELLLADALGLSRERLVLEPPRAVDALAAARFEALVTRREAREPVAYLVGRKEFRRSSLRVDHRVLIPRPETELLVEVGLRLPAGARVIDVGTGSGAVALALADERPDLEVWASDVSADALEVATENARRLGLRVRFARADLLEGLGQRFDAVLANLPYVADWAELPPEVAVYEPTGALLAGSDGLREIRRLLAGLVGVSVVGLEVGFDQAETVAAMMVDAGYQSIERWHDLAGHERVIVGRR